LVDCEKRAVHLHLVARLFSFCKHFIMLTMATYLGVDTGGTFTDFVLYDDQSQTIRRHKVLSTPAAPEQAILQGVRELGVADQPLSLVHGSTVATNAVLEGKGVSTVYITNRGLTDVLAIGRQAREQLYNLTPEKRAPLIAADHCLGVNSRLAADGTVLEQLDSADLDALADQIKRLAPSAVAVNLLFSYLDSTEEIKIEQAIRQLVEHAALPDVFISRSSDVLPEYREFERGITTTLNAMVGPLMQGYLHRLETALPESRLSVMQSSAGITSVRQAGQYPVRLLLSGPAGGLRGAQACASASGITKLLTFDMGGTSTDVSIIDGDIGFTTGARIAGHPVAVPMINMHTIGAGGGSIARVDSAGMLLVGPESAGASPGPACYARGGHDATVTDANVVLGRIPARRFLGGDMPLDVPAAEGAVDQVARQLGITRHQAADGIISVVNDHMVRALRVMSVELGEDPADYTLVAFGGAGGLHVCALAEELQMRRAMVPVNAGVLSALGMLAAESSRERSRSINQRLGEVAADVIAERYTELEQQIWQELGTVEDADSVQFMHSCDVRYAGQSHALNLDWHGIDQLEQAFHDRHEAHYGHRLPVAIELVNVRVKAVVRQQVLALPRWQPSEPRAEEMITLPGIEQAVKLVNRAGLAVHDRVNGPALITENSATTWLAAGWTAEVDDAGNLVLHCQA
jgi:N-methylhydantoinase A